MGSLEDLLARAGGPSLPEAHEHIAKTSNIDGGDSPASDHPVNHDDPMLEDVIIVVDVAANIPIGALPASVMHDLRKMYTWPNPGYFNEKKYKTMVPQDKYLFGYYELNGCICFPRGCLRTIIARLHRDRIGVKIIDASVSVPLSDQIIAHVALNREQQDVFDKLYKKRFGILKGAGGSGLKKVAIHLIGARKERTLIVVKKKYQLYQWKSAILEFTSARESVIGLLGDRHCEIDNQIVIAIDRSLYPHIESLKSNFGFLIIDRCDIANMKIFYRIVWHHPARYLLGIAHSKKHHGGLTDMMTAFLGDFRGEISGPDDSLSMPDVISVETGINFTASEYDQILKEMCEHQSRNDLIVMDILAAAASKKRVVVVAARIAHLNRLAEAVEKNYRSTGIITGKLSKNALAEVIDKFRSGDISVVFVTTKSIPADMLPPGNDVFVVSPYKYQDTTEQLVRCAAGQRPGRIVDYVDAHPFTQASWSKRRLSYNRLGLNIKACQEKNEKK